MLYEHISNYWYWYMLAASIAFRIAAEVQHYQFMSLLPANKVRKLEQRRVGYNVYNVLFWVCLIIFLIAVFQY